jgi:hypothetical protein
MKNKIKAKDLKFSKYFFLYHPGRFERGGIGDGLEYRHPWITVCRGYSDCRTYASTVFSMKGQTHRGNGEAERPSYAWDVDCRIENLNEPAVLKFINALKKSRYYSKEIRGIMRALREANIPRYVEDRIPNSSTRYTPRKYKGRESDFHNAFDLVAT